MRPLRIDGESIHQVGAAVALGLQRRRHRRLHERPGALCPATRTSRSRSPRRSPATCARAGDAGLRRSALTGVDAARARSSPDQDDPAAEAAAERPRDLDRARPRPRSPSITTRATERMGFFTDTTVCIGCKACEVACKQWNDLPADGSQFSRGGSYDHTGELSARRPGGTCASSSCSSRPRSAAPQAAEALAAAGERSTWRGRWPTWIAGSSCPTSASTARTPAASTPARPAR